MTIMYINGAVANTIANHITSPPADVARTSCYVGATTLSFANNEKYGYFQGGIAEFGEPGADWRLLQCRAGVRLSLEL